MSFRSGGWHILNNDTTRHDTTQHNMKTTSPPARTARMEQLTLQTTETVAGKETEGTARHGLTSSRTRPTEGKAHPCPARNMYSPSIDQLSVAQSKRSSSQLAMSCFCLSVSLSFIGNLTVQDKKKKTMRARISETGCSHEKKDRKKKNADMSIGNRQERRRKKR